MKPTKDERALARLHATAWGDAWDGLRNQVGRAHPVADVQMLQALSVLAMFVSGGYRKIANGGEIAR